MTHTTTPIVFLSRSLSSEANNLGTLRTDHQIFTSVYIFMSSFVSARKQAALPCGLKKGNGIWLSTSSFFRQTHPQLPSGLSLSLPIN